MIAANISAGYCSYKEAIQELDIYDHYLMLEILAVKNENQRRADKAAEQNRSSS